IQTGLYSNMLFKVLMILCLAVCVFGDDKKKCAGKFDKEGSEFAIGDSWDETLNDVKADCTCPKERYFLWTGCYEDWCDDAARDCRWEGCYSRDDGKAYAVGARVSYRGQNCVCGETEEFIADALSQKYSINC
ncbi:unnamed protein product, partial [Owenia fusiformis]